MSIRNFLLLNLFLKPTLYFYFTCQSQFPLPPLLPLPSPSYLLHCPSSSQSGSLHMESYQSLGHSLWENQGPAHYIYVVNGAAVCVPGA